MGNNRRKGHDVERHFRKEFQGMGYAHCETSRYASRMHDDAGVDLVNLPINVQIKAGYKRGINYSKVLREMRDRIADLFGKESHEQGKIRIVLHRKDGKRGQSRENEDDLVVMTFEDFKKMLKLTDL